MIVAGDSVRLRTDSDSAADHGSSIYGLADGGRLQTRLVQPLYRWECTDPSALPHPGQTRRVSQGPRHEYVSNNPLPALASLPLTNYVIPMRLPRVLQNINVWNEMYTCTAHLAVSYYHITIVWSHWWHHIMFYNIVWEIVVETSERAPFQMFHVCLCANSPSCPFLIILWSERTQ